MGKTKKLNNDIDAKEVAYKNATGRLEYTLTNDYLFHIVMQKNEKVLRGLIGSLLGLSQDEIVKVDLKNPIIPGQSIGDKEVILDLMIILNDAKFLNIEMQVGKRKDWAERSLTYLCRNYDNLSKGDVYSDVMPCLHIGIIDFDLFEDMHEFYSIYRIKNIKNERIYTNKFGINVLNLRCIDNATEADKRNKLDVWARLFKARTWEEIKMIAENYDFAREAANSIYAVSADEAIRLQCEARERYERDWASSYESGRREGVSQEKVNTDREKKRADGEKKRADEAEQRADEAETKLDEALREIERLKAAAN